MFGDQFDARVDDLYMHCQTGARIRRAKTGTEQWCEILRPSVRHILRQYAATRFPGQSLFGFSSDQYRRFFKRIGLSSTYVPHSLRRGGATLLFSWAFIWTAFLFGGAGLSASQRVFTFSVAVHCYWLWLYLLTWPEQDNFWPDT